MQKRGHLGVQGKIRILGKQERKHGPHRGGLSAGPTFMQADLKSKQKKSFGERRQVEDAQAVLSSALVFLCCWPSDTFFSFLSNS